MGAAAYAISLLTELPGLISAGKDVIDLIKSSSTALKSMQDQGREPTDAEWSALNSQIKALRDELHAP